MAIKDDKGNLHDESNGQFTNKESASSKREEAEKIYNSEPTTPPTLQQKKKMMPAEKVALTKNIVKIDLNTQVQKQLETAQSPKERQQIAYRYIMDNLRGKYTAPDGRTVAIEKVGADKITHRDIKVKLRVCPALADMIKVGELEGISTAIDKSNPKFIKFAYYRVPFQFGEEKYTGLLNVGIRADGSSTLYDLNPFQKI